MSYTSTIKNWTEVNNENIRQLWECPDCGKEIYTNPGLVQFKEEQIPPVCDNYEHHTNTEVMRYVRTEINNPDDKTLAVQDMKPTETFNIGESRRVELGDCSTKYNEYFGFDFVDDDSSQYKIYMSRDKLRGLADFIYKYLENN